jgi:hypothetical protein
MLGPRAVKPRAPMFQVAPLLMVLITEGLILE